MANISPASDQRLPLDGTELHYDVAGSGPPLVLAHAGIADRSMWDEQFTALAEHFQVIRYDLRGFGQTAPVTGEFAHRHDLLRLLDHLGLERAHLLGCSKGGGVCLDFALEFPDRVAGLVLVCSSPGGYAYAGEAPPQWPAMEAAFRAGDFARAAELEVQIWVDGPQRSPDQVPAAVRDRVRAMDVVALTHEAQGLGTEQPRLPPAAERLGEVTAPTLVIIGGVDVPDLIAAGHYLAAHIPNASEFVIADAAHLPNLEQPELFNQLVTNFLQSTQA
jgi:3-oxoadipate enol-lactonase